LSKPKLYVVAAPSGGGKTSLIKALLKRDDRICLSVSHTTRAPRPGEIAGRHYHFVDEQAFLALIAQNAFLEHARVFDQRYGTGPACCSLFILPPSLEALRQRLAGRGQDSAKVIERRMKDARAEISHCDEFDFMIVNDDFGLALADLHSIIRHGKPQRREQRDQLTDLVAELLKNG